MTFSIDRRRLLTLTMADVVLLMEMTWRLAGAAFSVRFLPFRRVVGTLRETRVAAPDERYAKAEVERVRWAVMVLANRLPWKIVCIQKALALHKALSRRGIKTLLHYGVAHGDGRELKAHVWVTHDGDAVVGGRESWGFAHVATFPSVPAGQMGQIPMRLSDPSSNSWRH